MPTEEITDPKLLSRLRALIRAEHAGYLAEGNRCVEPGCSCGQTWEGESDPVCGPFREPGVRCTSFEKAVLPLDPDLEDAYWDHLETGSNVRVRRCRWPHCRRQVASMGPAAKYCELHADLSRRAAGAC